MSVKIEPHALFGELLKTRRRGVQVKQKVVETYEMDLYTRAGANLNIDELSAEVGQSLAAKIAFREASLLENFVIEDSATIVDPARGTITFTLPSDVRDKAGIYHGEIALVGTDSNLYALNELYVYVEPTHWSDTTYTTPQLDDIRMSLRDSSLFENELLGNLEYDVAEISYAAARTVRYWNETPPPVVNFTTRAFPFLNIWLMGIQVFLFDLIQEFYRRNQFTYSAGGLSIDDRNKFALYRTAWMDKMQMFQQEVRRVKARINAENSVGTIWGSHQYYAI